MKRTGQDGGERCEEHLEPTVLFTKSRAIDTYFLGDQVWAPGQEGWSIKLSQKFPDASGSSIDTAMAWVTAIMQI